MTDAREQLCKSFCVTTCCGNYLLLASQTPAQQPTQQQQQQERPEGLPGVPCVETTTLHVVSAIRENGGVPTKGQQMSLLKPHPFDG